MFVGIEPGWLLAMAVLSRTGSGTAQALGTACGEDSVGVTQGADDAGLSVGPRAWGGP